MTKKNKKQTKKKIDLLKLDPTKYKIRMVRTTVRIPNLVHSQLGKMSKAKKQSFNALIIHSVIKMLNRHA